MKPVKKIGSKKMQELLKQQENKEQDKKYEPGKIEVKNSDHCKCRVVNFFGDVHTETYSLKMSPDDKSAAVGCSNGEIRLYDVQKGEVLSVGNTFHTTHYPCTGVRWNPLQPNQGIITSNCDGTLKWYTPQAPSNFHYVEDTSFLCLDVQSQGHWTVVGADTFQLHLVDNIKNKQFMLYPGGYPDELENNLHSNRIFSVKCLPQNPDIFFSAGWDSTIQFWDVRVGGRSIRKIIGPSVASDSMDYHKDCILVGNYRNNNIAQLYDFKSGKLMQVLDIKQPPNGPSYCFTAAFAHRSEHDLIAVGLSGSNVVKILKDKEVVSQIMFQATPLSLAFYRFNGKDFIVVGGIEGTVYVIKVKIK